MLKGSGPGAEPVLHPHGGAKVRRETCCGLLGWGVLYQLVENRQKNHQKKKTFVVIQALFLILNALKAKARILLLEDNTALCGKNQIVSTEFYSRDESLQ